MNQAIVSLKPAHIGHKLFVCVTSDEIFRDGNTHTVMSLIRNAPGDKLKFRSWINSHHNTGIEWNRITKRLNFGEENE
jgi:hypothetical protein